MADGARQCGTAVSDAECFAAAEVVEAVDEVEVGVADAAVRYFDEDLGSGGGGDLVGLLGQVEG